MFVIQETNARKEVGLILVNLGRAALLFRCLQDVSRKTVSHSPPRGQHLVATLNRYFVRLDLRGSAPPLLHITTLTTGSHVLPRSYGGAAHV